ncbi:MAG: YhjD/YihY/BrkB family envelope integrity protein [Myxococcota bacterium]
MNRLTELWQRAGVFLREELWTAEFEPRTWAARALALVRFVVMVGEGFVRDQLLLRASALTYFTVLSLVPLLMIVSSIVTALGVTENVVGPVIDQIARISPDVATYLRELLETANVGGLGTIGAVTLFLTTVLGISNIERALNHIWGVKHERPWGRRIPDYMAVLIIAPLVLAVGLSMATTIKSQWIIERMLSFPLFAAAWDLGLKQLPTVVIALGFSFLYWFLPNTSVRAASALLGGFFSGFAVQATLGLYVGFSVGAARANALYGVYASLPLFFVFVYLFWAIVLFGAEIAFAYQNLKLYVREVRGARAGSAEREAVGLRMVLEIARSFRDRTSPWTSDELSDSLRVPARTVRDILMPLHGARIVAALDESEKESGIQLGAPAETMLVTEVLEALRGPRENTRGDASVVELVERVLNELSEGAEKAAGGRTVADLVAVLPPGPARG